MLGVGLMGVVRVMVCDLAIVRRDTYGVYEKEVSPRGAPGDPALHEASAGKRVVGVSDDSFFEARRDMGAAYTELREDVRGCWERWRERRRDLRWEREERLERERVSL